MLDDRLSEHSLRKKLSDASELFGEKRLARAALTECYDSILPRLLRSSKSSEILHAFFKNLPQKNTLGELADQLVEFPAAFYSVFKCLAETSYWSQDPSQLRRVSRALGQEEVYNLAYLLRGPTLRRAMDNIGKIAGGSQSEFVTSQAASLIEMYGPANFARVLDFIGEESEIEKEKWTSRKKIEAHIQQKIDIFKNPLVASAIKNYSGILSSDVIFEFGTAQDTDTLAGILLNNTVRHYLTHCDQGNATFLSTQLGMLAENISEDAFPALSGFLEVSSPAKAIKFVTYSNSILPYLGTVEERNNVFRLITGAAMKHNGEDFENLMTAFEFVIEATGDRSSIGSICKLSGAYSGKKLLFFLDYAAKIASGGTHDEILGNLRSFSYYFSKPNIAQKVAGLDSAEYLLFTSAMENSSSRPARTFDFASRYLEQQK